MSADLQIIHVVGANGQPLPIHGHGLGSDWGNTVKEEREDESEIREMAAKIKEAQKDALAKTALANSRQLMQTNGLTASAAAQASYGVTANGQTNIMSYLTRQNQMTNGSASINGRTNGVSDSNGSTDKKLPLDEESQKGRFGWTSFGKIHIPFIFRGQEKYCSVRMIEFKLLGKYLNCLHPDIYSSCTCVRSYYITDAESRLFNEINAKHCDNGFGRDMFTQKDLVVRLNDATKFYQFLDICYRKLVSGNKTPSDKCGFIRINKESVVPYTLRNNEQVVPLFYFEGETENLKQKADYLSGWDLAYLKFCCKVQGIRNELFSSENVAVISLTDIKSYFPNGTEFEDYWPSKVVDSNLLIGNRTNVNNSVNWTRQPAQPPPKVISQGISQKQHSTAAVVAAQQQQMLKRSASNSNANAYNNAQSVAVAAAAAAAANQRGGLHSSNVLTPATVQALSNGSWLPQSQTAAANLHLLQAQMIASQQAQQAQHGNSRGQYRTPMDNLILGNRNAFAAAAHNVYNSASISMQAVSNQSQGNAPPPLVRANGQNSNHMSLEAAAVLLQQQQQQQQAAQQQQQSHQQRLMQAAAHHYNQQNGGRNSSSSGAGSNSNNSASLHLQRHAAMVAASGVSNSDVNSQRLSIIPEIPTNNITIQPYKMQKVFVDKQMVPCINMKAYNDSDQLMTLNDFQKFFFPSIPLDRCKRVIEHLGVELYKGNRRQLQVLLEHDRLHNENIPLVQVRDVLKYMPQLQFMARIPEAPPAKRSRNS